MRTDGRGRSLHVVTYQLLLLVIGFGAGAWSLGSVEALVCIVYDVLVGWAPPLLFAFLGICLLCALLIATVRSCWAAIVPLTVYVSISSFVLGGWINRLPAYFIELLGFGFSLTCGAVLAGTLIRLRASGAGVPEEADRRD